jgi:hypothetical protein
MKRFLIYAFVGALTFTSGTRSQRAVEAVKVAANMVWVAHYFPDVAVDLFDYMHRPTVSIEDPVANDAPTVRRRASCHSHNR